MSKSDLLHRFINDAEHLKWKSEVHRLSPGEVISFYDELTSAYHHLATATDRHTLDAEFDYWNDVFSKITKAHANYPDRGLKPQQ